MPAATVPKSTGALAVAAVLTTAAYLILGVHSSPAYSAEDAAILTAPRIGSVRFC